MLELARWLVHAFIRPQKTAEHTHTIHTPGAAHETSDTVLLTLSHKDSKDDTPSQEPTHL